MPAVTSVALPITSCQLSCSLEGQCGPSWSLLDPIMETGVSRVLGQLGQNTIQWVALDHPSSSWGQAGDRSGCRWSSSTSLSKRKSRAAQHSLGPSALPLSQELYRCLLCSSPSHHLFAIIWKEDRNFCAAFHHSQAEGHGKG